MDWEEILEAAIVDPEPLKELGLVLHLAPDCLLSVQVDR